MACSFKICTKKIIAKLAHRLLCFAFWNAENVHTTCLLFFFWRYHYRLLSGPESASVFEKNSAWHISEDLDIQAMKVKSVAVFCLFADVKLCCCFTDGVSSSESMQHTCWPSWFQFISSSWMSGDIYFLTIVNHQVSEVHGVHKEVYRRQRHILYLYHDV